MLDSHALSWRLPNKLFSFIAKSEGLSSCGHRDLTSSSEDVVAPRIPTLDTREMSLLLIRAACDTRHQNQQPEMASVPCSFPPAGRSCEAGSRGKAGSLLQDVGGTRSKKAEAKLFTGKSLRPQTIQAVTNRWHCPVRAQENCTCLVQHKG